MTLVSYSFLWFFKFSAVNHQKFIWTLVLSHTSIKTSDVLAVDALLCKTFKINACNEILESISVCFWQLFFRHIVFWSSLIDYDVILLLLGKHSIIVTFIVLCLIFISVEQTSSLLRVVIWQKKNVIDSHIWKREKSKFLVSVLAKMIISGRSWQKTPINNCSLIMNKLKGERECIFHDIKI